MSDIRVYFEKQGADRLCGVHCLNSLAQGPVFTQVDLNKYASQLDKEEAALLSADPSKPKAPRQMTIASLSNQPKSEHQDVTGYFSLGVLEKALAHKFGISVQNAARKDIIQKINMHGLDDHEGFVVHLRDHWFAARAIPNPQYPGVREWYFLDSLKDAPMPATENELWGTIQGIIQSGGNVFVLSDGHLPAPPTAASKPFILKAHQYVLSREEIKRRLAGEPEPVRDLRNQPKPVTDWNSLGAGQTLGGPQRALTESVKELGQLKPEPGPDDTSVVTVMVRLGTGQRHTRKLSTKKDTVSDLFVWLSGRGVAATSSIVGTMERRGWKLSRHVSGQILFISKLGASEVFLSPSAVLSDLGLGPGQEAFNIQ
jgi:hypothetical protein